jgi:hypothetical protein
MKIELNGTQEEIENAIKDFYIQTFCGFGEKPNLCIKQLFDEAFKYDKIVYDKNSNCEFSKQLLIYGMNALVNCHGEYLQFIIEDFTGLLKTWFEENDGDWPFNTSKIVMFVGSTKAMLGAY